MKIIKRIFYPLLLLSLICNVSFSTLDLLFIKSGYGNLSRILSDSLLLSFVAKEMDEKNY